MDGGTIIAKFLKKQGVPFLFTLCGGHISPILVGCKKEGIRVIDVRHEATAVFAADAVARLTGIPGVAAVTAGPGVTNTITALRNAYQAQSPLILLGGATATVLKGRGSLQDIDQFSLVEPNVKAVISVSRVKELVPSLSDAFHIAQSGVPGPVFVECPIDLLYPEAVVREWYFAKGNKKPTLQDRALNFYLSRHLNRQFSGAGEISIPSSKPAATPEHSPERINEVKGYLRKAKKPVIILGSQASYNPQNIQELVYAIERLNIPVYLSGMARGLLGKNHHLQLKHKRKEALKQADTVILAGVPCDFRLDYGNHIKGHSAFISINRSKEDLYKNKRPECAVLADPGIFLKDLAFNWDDGKKWDEWLNQLKENDGQRETEISAMAEETVNGLNPVRLLREMNKVIGRDSILIGDGGDFTATASYTVSPRSPLSWLDPGVFGTLGVGAGFALGARLCRPESEVWIIFGDGAAGYSLVELDTFKRHGLPVIAVVGNDSGWSQIARDQVEILKDDVGTVLDPTDYHIVAKGFGAEGLLLNSEEQLPEVFERAKEAACNGSPVLINAIIGKTDFRKGSISM